MQTAEQTLLHWLKQNALTVRYRQDASNFTISEFGTGKQLAIDTKKIRDFRLMPHPQGFKDYLNLVFDDGKQIVLCHAGIAFSPSFISTGPLDDAPPVSCMTDYLTLRSNLNELIKDPSQRLHAIALFQVLISILDGAREIGLDVSAEEDELDKKLTEFESHS